MALKKQVSDSASGGECKTKARIIAAAERMIAGRGVQQFSIRDITREADVNLAAINYHFGSKERLIAEVLARRIFTLNEQRMAQLNDLEKASTRGPPPSVEAIMEVAIRTMLRIDDKERSHYTDTAKMLSRFFLEPDEEIARMLKPHFMPFKDRIVKMLSRALPDLKHEELEWRAHQALGLLGHHMLFAEMRCRDTGKKLNVKKEQRRLLVFCSAALRAKPEIAGT